MGVNHRGLHILVPEKLLHGSNVLSVLQQMGRKRMTERVARRRLGNAAPTGRVPDRLYSREVGWSGKHPNGERCSRMELFMTGSISYCCLRKLWQI